MQINSSPMKTTYKISAVLLIAMGIFINACQKDTLDPATPADSRDKYTGSWTCSETNTKTNKKNVFTVSISKAAANSSDLILSNFNNIGGSTAYYVKSSLSGSSISIPSQDVLGDQISGSGSIAADTKINFTYTVYDPNGTTDAYAAIYTK